MIMSLRFMNTKINNKHYCPLATFLYYFTNLYLFGEKCPTLTFWRMNSPHRLCNVGEDPAMIYQNYLFHIFVTTNKASNNKNI